MSFATLQTIYGLECVEEESGARLCCLDQCDTEDESNNCCDENSKGTCCNVIYVAVLTASNDQDASFCFTDRIFYPTMDNSFLSSYINVPFHPPQIG